MAFDVDAFLNGTSQPIQDQPIKQQPSSGFDADAYLNNPSGSDQQSVDQSLANYATLQKKYGTPGQQALASGEGLAGGFLGPGKELIEKGLTKIGVPGLTPEEQAGRAQANPLLHGAAEAVGLGAGFLTGTGEAAIVGKLGEAAKVASGLNEATTISKLASTGIRTGAEMAALQAGNELSNVINDAPNSLGTAAINIGLSGILGGAGGAALGAVSPLWKTAANKIGVEKVANDFMGETDFINNSLKDSTSLADGAAKEVNGRMAEADQIISGGLKGQAIEKALPEATPENIAKIDSHLQEISDLAEKRINEASQNAYLKGTAPKLAQDLKDFQEVISDPNANISDKWDALDQFKRASQGHADYNIVTAGPEEKAISKWIKPFNIDLREALEDSKIWGEAGNIQKNVNKATSDLFAAQKDFVSKVTSKELGERVADPTKLNTILNQAEKGKAGLNQAEKGKAGLNQAEKGKAGLKLNAVRNYLDATQKAADAINAAHVNVGLEAPLESKLNSTPILDHTLKTPLSPGRSLAQWANRQGAATLAGAVGKSTAGITGGGLGALVGHPLAGAWIGEKVLTPVLSHLAKPFAEMAINAEGMKASVEYLAKVAKGDQLLKGAAASIFKGSAETIPREYLPNENSREKLQKSLDVMNENPQNMMNVGGNIGHYLPQHGMAAAEMAAKSVQYLNSLKPKSVASSPFDKPAPPNKNEMDRYNRALDIAQQPLIVLKHLKDGTLLLQDIQTLSTIYPGLHKSMVQKIGQELIERKSKNEDIPYRTRIGISQLMGNPMDSTMTVQGIQAIMMASSNQREESAAAPRKSHHTTEATLDQINKVNSLYQTEGQARQANQKA